MALKTGDIKIGQMRQKGTFQSNTPIQNDSGGFADNFTDLYTCRGRLQPKTGMRRNESGQLVRNSGFEFVVRYTTQLVTNFGTRVVIAGENYAILDSYLVDQSNHFYCFILSNNAG